MQGYLKLNEDRIKKFYSKTKNTSTTSKKFDENEYIEIRKIESGSYCQMILVYYIEKEELLAIKQISNDKYKLFNREKENYSKISHEFLPKFYGTTRKNYGIVIEYINGQTLKNISQLHLNEKEKYSIIFQILVIFKHLHDMHFIYRDLKPNNIMIDRNKMITLIDFDRMINDTSIDDDDEHTQYFSHNFMAPEISIGCLSSKCDVYSIGQMIYYIINEREPNNESSINSKQFLNYPEMKILYDICTNEDLNERPLISGIIPIFSEFIISKNILLENIGPDNQYKFGLVAEIENNSKMLIQYLTLASNQNHVESHFKLSEIYSDGIYVKYDMNKSIHYLT